jgi:hypothetical protein
MRRDAIDWEAKELRLAADTFHGGVIVKRAMSGLYDCGRYVR